VGGEGFRAAAFPAASSLSTYVPQRWLRAPFRRRRLAPPSAHPGFAHVRSYTLVLAILPCTAERLRLTELLFEGGHVFCRSVLRAPRKKRILGPVEEYAGIE